MIAMGLWAYGPMGSYKSSRSRALCQHLERLCTEIPAPDPPPDVMALLTKELPWNIRGGPEGVVDTAAAHNHHQ